MNEEVRKSTSLKEHINSSKLLSLLADFIVSLIFLVSAMLSSYLVKVLIWMWLILNKSVFIKTKKPPFFNKLGDFIIKINHAA